MSRFLFEMIPYEHKAARDNELQAGWMVFVNIDTNEELWRTWLTPVPLKLWNLMKEEL